MKFPIVNFTHPATVLAVALLLAAAPALAGNRYKGWTVVEVEAGPNMLEDLKTAFANAQPETIIQLPKATIQVDSELEISSSHVRVRGRNPKRTILDFSTQVSGGQGLLVSGDHVVLENFTVRDTPGDGIRAQRVSGETIEELVGITFRKLKVEWTSPNDAEHGAYGVYPVNSRDVLVEKTEIIGASDAGVYVGQSNNIIVTKNKVHGNVAGIEIENSNDADVFKNKCWDNTGAILVFNHPHLSQTGSRTRVFKNKLTGNNHANFGTGTVGQVPPGTGVIVLANDEVEIFRNKIYGHGTGGIEIASHDLVDIQRPFDPWPETIWIHDNKYKNNGFDPRGVLGLVIDDFLDGGRDIVWDRDVDPDKLVDGMLPEEFRICIGEKKFTYGSGNMTDFVTDPETAVREIVLEPSEHFCEHASLPEITIPDPPPAP